MPPRAAVFTLALLGWVGRVAAQGQAPPAPAGTAVIRGRVIAADTGRPLRRARIAITMSGAAGPPRTANTDPEGRYQINELSGGHYTLTAARSGYLALRYGQRRPLELARPLDVADGQTIDAVDFALPKAALISGRVSDEVGDPIGGVTVFALRSEYFQGRRQLVPTGPPVQSDDAGRYRLTGLSPGNYVLRATTRETWQVTRAGKREKMGFAPTYFPGTDDPKQAQPVTIRSGGDTGSIDFSMVPARTATVSGTAFDSHGRPAASVGLVQETTGPSGGSVGMAGTTTVSGDGAFSIGDVPPGEYKLKAAGSNEVATLPIVIAAADVDNVSLVTSPGWSVSGTIQTDSGAAPDLSRERVRITVDPTAGFNGMRLQGEAIARQQLNDDWTFSASAIIGPARFRVTLPDGWMLTSIMANGRDVTDAAIEMNGGETLSGVQVIVSNRVTTLTAQLLDRGAPLTDGTVIVFARDAGKWREFSRFVRSARPNQQGQAQITGLPPGEYLAIALDDVQEGSWNDPAYLESLRRAAQEVTLTDADSRALSLTLAGR